MVGYATRRKLSLCREIRLYVSGPDQKRTARNREAEMETTAQNIALIRSVGCPELQGAWYSLHVSSGKKIYRIWSIILLVFMMPPGGKSSCFHSHIYGNFG
jgi:hypothetical protein